MQKQITLSNLVSGDRFKFADDESRIFIFKSMDRTAFYYTNVAEGSQPQNTNCDREVVILEKSPYGYHVDDRVMAMDKSGRVGIVVEVDARNTRARVKWDRAQRTWFDFKRLSKTTA